MYYLSNPGLFFQISASPHSRPAWHLSFGGEIGSKLEAPAGKGPSSYMLWSEFKNTKDVILEMRSKMKMLTKSVGDNSTGEYWTRAVLGGVGVVLVIGCVLIKVTKMKDILSTVTSSGWGPQPTSMALNNLGVSI